MTSGEPLNVLWGPPGNYQVSDIGPDWRGAISYRPNLVGTAVLPEASRENTIRYLDVTAFSRPQPTSRSAISDGTPFTERACGSWTATSARTSS